MESCPDESGIRNLGRNDDKGEYFDRFVPADEAGTEKRKELLWHR